LLYPVSSTLFLFLFIFLGINIGIMFNKLDKVYTINFLEDPRKSFFGILVLVLLMITSAGFAFKYFEKFASVFYFGQTLNAQEINQAENSINKALILNQNDLYYRTASQVYLSKINLLLSNNESISDESRVVVQNSINQAINFALAAVDFNPQGYLNHELLGFAYKNALSLGIEDTSQKAIDAYTKASELNPLNPLLKLEIARIYFLEKKFKEAREEALVLMELKPDFLQGLIFLAQLEELEGNNKTALSYAQDALLILPSDQSLLDYVETLKNKTTPVVNNPTEEDSN
jgi:tetratricopeptide (TPR) repeat protein